MNVVSLYSRIHVLSSLFLLRSSHTWFTLGFSLWFFLAGASEKNLKQILWSITQLLYSFCETYEKNQWLFLLFAVFLCCYFEWLCVSKLFRVNMAKLNWDHQFCWGAQWAFPQVKKGHFNFSEKLCPCNFCEANYAQAACFSKYLNWQSGSCKMRKFMRRIKCD